MATIFAGRRVRKLSPTFGMFVCWSFSTFCGHEWTPGVEDISFFNPTGFDPDQWCRTAQPPKFSSRPKFSIASPPRLASMW